MSKVKGRYVATVIMDFEYEDSPSMQPFDKIKNTVVHGELTKAIQEVLADDIFDKELGLLKVEQQYADLYMVGENE